MAHFHPAVRDYLPIITVLRTESGDLAVQATKWDLLLRLYENIRELSPTLLPNIVLHLRRQNFHQTSARQLRNLTNQGLLQPQVWNTIINIFKLPWRSTDACYDYCLAIYEESLFVKVIRFYISFNMYPEEGEYLEKKLNLIHAVLAVTCNIVRHPNLNGHFSSEAVKQSLVRYATNTGMNREIRVAATIILTYLVDPNREPHLQNLEENYQTIMDALHEAVQNPHRIAHLSQWDFRGEFSAEELFMCLNVVTANAALGLHMIAHCGMVNVIESYSRMNSHRWCLHHLTRILLNLMSYPDNKAAVQQQMNVRHFIDAVRAQVIALNEHEEWITATLEYIDAIEDCLNTEEDPT